MREKRRSRDAALLAALKASASEIHRIYADLKNVGAAHWVTMTFVFIIFFNLIGSRSQRKWLFSDGEFIVPGLSSRWRRQLTHARRVASFLAKA